MQNSSARWRDGAFLPVNTLHNPPDPSITRKPLEAMQNEQDPFGGRKSSSNSQQQQQENSTASDDFSGSSQPEFGKPSPLRSKFKKDTSIFNIPDPRKPRPEHHRRPQPSVWGSTGPSSQWPQSGLRMSPQHSTSAAALTADFFEETRISSSQSSQSSQVLNHKSRPSWEMPPLFQAQKPKAPATAGFEIPKPFNLPSTGSQAVERPMFSSNTSTYRPLNAAQPRSTDHPKEGSYEDEDDRFDANKAFENSKFGDYDPLNYVEATQAQEDIRALLEGAIEEDEDDKPTVKLRKRRPKSATQPKSLADKLQALEVSGKKESETAEEEEVDDGSVEGLNVKLLPHQIDGVAWMLDKEIGERKKNGVLPNGGILADDMGLGKTIQALSLILSNPKPETMEAAAKKKRKIPDDATGCTLVVAPLALIKQWEAEIKSKVLKSQNLKVLVHHGPSRKRRADDLKKYDIVITTYQTLTSEHGDSPTDESKPRPGCMGVCWWRVILDEAHSIKNRNAKMTKAAYALRSVYRWCLTGTPMQNNLDEIQSLICFLRIKPYMDLAKWRSHIGGPMKNGRGGIAMKRLQYFLKSFMKRRTKDILKKEGALDFGKGQKPDEKGQKKGFQIVERNVKTIEVQFTDEERETYSKFEERTGKSLQDMLGGSKQDYIGALVLLLRLRQLCNHRNLMKGNIQKEKETIDPSLQTPRKSKTGGTSEMDDVADLMGNLTVESKNCDICRTKLYKENTASDGIRCFECTADLKEPESRPTANMKKPLAHKKKTQGRHVIESDDEDEDDDDEGEWLVPEEERPECSSGKAGDTDDENAEGEGQSLGEEDSDTEDNDDEEDDDDEKPVKRRPALSSKFETSSDISNQSDDGESDEDIGKVELVPATSKMVPSSKIKKLIEILEEESDQHKFIVFSEFTSMLDIVEPFLHNAGFRFTRYDGSMRNDEREASLDRLRNDFKTRILLCSLRCGSLGLNLTAASRVVILEPFWNPFVEEQAIDRVHRLNQTKDVMVYRFTIPATVEERILALQEKKRELAKAAIEGGSQAVGKLTMKDILKLFKQDAETQENVVYLGARPAPSTSFSGGTARQAYKPPQTMNNSTNNSVYGRRWY